MIKVIKHPVGSNPPGEGWTLRENDSSAPTGYNLWQKTINETVVSEPSTPLHQTNYDLRRLATQGYGTLSRDNVKDHKDFDYYEPTQGNKRYGKIHSVHDNKYSVKDYGTGKIHHFKYLEDFKESVNEDLAKDATASDYIDDFVHSKNKTFKGDSKKERIKRALGAYYSQKNEEVDEVKEAFLDDVDKNAMANESVDDIKEGKSLRNNINYIGRSVYHKGTGKQGLVKNSYTNGSHEILWKGEKQPTTHDWADTKRSIRLYEGILSSSVNENDIQGEIEDHLDNCCHDSGHIKKEIPGATDQMIRNMKKKRSSERKYYKEEVSSYKSLESVIREIATQKLHN